MEKLEEEIITLKKQIKKLEYDKECYKKLIDDLYDIEDLLDIIEHSIRKFKDTRIIDAREFYKNEK
jgi:cell shape-determining protein MreC